MSDKDKNITDEKKALSDNDVLLRTASMWKYNPIPESPEPFSEYKNSYENSDGTEIIGARVRGKKHKHNGSNCDDWYDCARVSDCVIAAVSDGAGSKVLSRIGARVSCEAVISKLKNEISSVYEMCPDIKDILSRAFDDTEFTSLCSKLAAIVQDSFLAAFSAVENAYKERLDKTEFEEALGRKPDISDYSGTLLAAVLIPVKNGEHFIISLQVGDGITAAVNSREDFSDALKILGTPSSGDFAGETEFLTSKEILRPDSLSSRTKILRGKISTMLLMTDGVADDYYPNHPELLRLYIDLMLNGIIHFPTGAELPKKKKGIFHKKEKAAVVPEPVAYPWVNDTDVEYSLQYSKNIMLENGLTLPELWEMRFDELVCRSRLKSFDISNGSDRSERLCVWLDNYVERGSFDDRTLLVINVT